MAMIDEIPEPPLSGPGGLSVCVQAELARRPLLHHFYQECRRADDCDALIFDFKGPHTFHFHAQLRIPPGFCDEEVCRSTAKTFVHHLESGFVSELKAYERKAAR